MFANSSTCLKTKGFSWTIFIKNTTFVVFFFNFMLFMYKTKKMAKKNDIPHLLNSLEDGKTSLGHHPAFPPDEEDRFIVDLFCKKLDDLGIDENTQPEELEQDATKILADIVERESKNSASLVKLCEKVIFKLFEVPEDTVLFEFSLTDKVKKDDIPLTPVKTSDFVYEDVEEMETITEKIYQRRFMNALTAGASLYYASKIKDILTELFDIDEELPGLYTKLLRLNNKLLYLKKDTLVRDNAAYSGRVDVFLGNEDIKPKIKATGVAFPFLLEESIKGVLELANSKGLADSPEIMKFVLSKADFRLAENWDMRLGYVLWGLFLKRFEELEVSMKDVGLNFLFMELSLMEPSEFNKLMRNVLANTKKGKVLLSNIVNEILDEKEYDDFNNFMELNDDSLTLEDGYFKPGELLNVGFGIANKH